MKDFWYFVVKSGVMKEEEGRAGGVHHAPPVPRRRGGPTWLWRSNTRMVHIEM